MKAVGQRTKVGTLIIGNPLSLLTNKVLPICLRVFIPFITRMENRNAVSLAFIGGLLFAYTYAQSRSTFACVLEHSLWGIWMFTLGMGDYLDSGALN